MSNLCRTVSMNSKTSYTICSSSSYKICEKLPGAIFDSNVVNRLCLAQQKLRPIIDDLMRTATKYSPKSPHYLSVEQYEDAIWASQILKEVDTLISDNLNGKGKKRTYNLNHFNLGRKNVKVNKSGKIYVDTSILIQLIELHKTLGDVINNFQEIHTESNCSNDTSSYTQTEHSHTTDHDQYDSYEGRDVSSDEKFNVYVMRKKNVENSKPKIKINVLRCRNNDPSDKNIVVMSAHTMKEKQDTDNTNAQKKLSTLPEERTSNSEANLTDSGPSSRKTRSTGSINSDERHSKVTDVAGARKIILNCLYDLNKVRSFLERVDIGVSAEVQIQSAVFDMNNEQEKTQLSSGQSKSDIKEDENPEDISHAQKKFRFESDPTPSDLHLQDKQNRNEAVAENNMQTKTLQSHPPQSESKGECCCGSTYASETPMEVLLDAGDENASKLIICIKGKTEEEGDVQIIIRQCSECKNVGGSELTDEMITDGRSVENVSDSAIHKEKNIPEKQDRKESESSDPISGISVLFDPKQQVKESAETHSQKPGLNVLFDPDDPSKSIVEPSKNLHSDKQPLAEKRSSLIRQSALVSSEESDPEKSGINVIFDPDDPSKSVIEPIKGVPSDKDHPLTTKESTRIDPGLKTVKDSETKTDDDCSRIKLYETTNLCFSTDDGQELVISLTIRPKEGGPIPKISLKDIFSDSTTGMEKSSPDQTREHIINIFGSEPEITVGLQDAQTQDNFIPLSRTKVCSSLEFDVALMETRIRSKGIKHINPSIVVRLKELGVNNLLRACRPVRCGRPAVLNEKLRKGVPYSASLTSLPLEEPDANIIDQSLEMSFNKIKHYSVRNKRKTLAYFTQLGDTADNIRFNDNNVQIRFLHVHPSWRSGSKIQALRNNYVQKKLGYYINLVHDVETEYKKRLYEVNFFEIKKHHINPALQKSTAKGNELNARHTNQISSPKREVKQKMSKVMGQAKQKINLENLKASKHQDLRTYENKKKFVSKIPIYKYNRNKRFTNNKVVSACNSNIYDISLQSLPKDDLEEKFKDIKMISHSDDQKTNFQDTMEKVNKSNTNSSVRNKVSDDSFELYFNNFFRDKYFSKLALCQKQSSSRSLKPRKKKSEYCCSKSQSQICINRSKHDQRYSNELSDRGHKFKRILMSHEGSCSKNIFNKYDENLKLSQSIIYYFTRIFCEYWVKDMLVEEKQHIKQKITNIKKFSSSIEILRNDAIQELFYKIKGRILEESSCKMSRFLSQPNVEAGMDNDNSVQKINVTRRKLVENLKGVPFKEIFTVPIKNDELSKRVRSMSKLDRKNNLIVINDKTKNNSCDKLQNVIVMFESHTSLAAVDRPLSKHYLSVTSKNTDYNILEQMTGDSLKNTEVDAPHYFVYQHSFKSPNLLQRMIEKSRNLFKSNCTNKHATVEYVNDKSLRSLQGKPSDGIDFCMCSNPREEPSTSFEIVSKKQLSETSTRPDCKICGCSIANCQSEITDKNECVCSVSGRLHSKKGGGSKSGLSRYKRSVKQTSSKFKPRKCGIKDLGSCRSKKSIGMLCIPKKVDMGICAKIGSKHKPFRRCYCIKCDKRAADGSCYCSHCLGIFDKSVGMTPSNREIGTQSVCMEKDRLERNNSDKNKTNANENEKIEAKANVENNTPIPENNEVLKEGADTDIQTNSRINETTNSSSTEDNKLLLNPTTNEDNEDHVQEDQAGRRESYEELQSPTDTNT